MSIRVAITHKTIYKYDREIALSPHTFRLRPAPHSRTPIEAYSIKISPEKQFFNWQQDPFGNYLARLVFPEKTNKLIVDVEIIADLKVINPFDFFVEEYAESYPFKYDKTLKIELTPYLEIVEDGKLLKEFMDTVDCSKKRIIDFLVMINQKVYEHLNYKIRLDPGIQTCEETLKSKSGSCRDFAWLLVNVLRQMGLAARFVSGYIVQLKADVESLDGPSGPEEDFTDLHAWCEVYIPGAGWLGLDSTSGLFAGEGHIPLACTPFPESAAPVSGALEKCEVEFSYQNTVTRLSETPRVTKPYTDEQWNAIYNLGFEIDKELEEWDVRLSMGGEPTFVSIDDMESPEWNTEADGKHKREIANTLIRRLVNTFGKGGMLHHGQGKWYPGEPLPRWQTTLYWRKDGSPIWNNPKYLGDHSQTYGFTTKDAETFLHTLCKYLGISRENAQPAYEDIYYMLWEERNLPVDVDPFSVDLDSPKQRKILAESLERGLGNPKGFVLPLNWGLTRWITCQWEFRRKHLYLTPGNSPVGLRLPLDSLIYKPQVELEIIIEPKLFTASSGLGEYHTHAKERVKDFDGKLRSGTTYTEFVRTAVCVEEREGRLYIFLPPMEKLEYFLDLIACIECTAEELDMPIIIEGYTPTKDNRIESITVSPDPGVIEVNIHPAKSWKELTENTLALYEEARQSRLGTEKFMLDGRHTGTGGGNHITVGGMIPSDSPFLRKPDMLRSLVTFWQHHPGLSYLFSGAFIGPTSQAPRVDEGRAENLYELEIAFSQIPQTPYVPYWLTDRLFRHLLTDITGNTHRSEFCIDKLYSPDSSTGRLGIVEMRAFDMPPHSQMSLLQMLLVRTLISWFWQKPYQHELVRWGTQLHDKYLLEHYVKEDLADIVRQLNDNGYPFKLEWFDPFFEFRFPTYGVVNIHGISMEIRAAIEPWHVLGEEMTGRGTSRYVDSSLERVQVKVNDFVDERYAVTCNGVRLDMASTGKKGEFVCGVRYKAWEPWSALHPTIGVDTPLVFDIVDLWSKRSIGGCTYFVAHPGGRSYDVYPVNSFEAESRRISRFWDMGHTQGTVAPVLPLAPGKVHIAPHEERQQFNYIELPENLEYPHTLDLRRKWHKA